VLDLQTGNKPVIPEEIQKTFIYPNPAKDKATIAVVLKKNEQADIRIYDAQGLLIDKLQTVTAVTAGTQKIPYKVKGNKPGIYNVVVTTNSGMRSTYKLIVQ
jgi:pectate lyase